MKNSSSQKRIEYFSYLLSLLGSVLNDEKPPKPNHQIDWALVFDIAKRHSVAGMFYCAVKRLDPEDKPPKDLLDSLKEMYHTELLYDTNRDFETERLFDEFRKHGLYCAPLKGYNVKRCYPNQNMRTMSDIDILYKKSQHKEIRRLFEKQGYTVVYDRLRELDFTCEPFHHYEFHSEMSNDEAYSDYYSDIWDRIVFDDNDFIGRLSAEDEYIYMLVHLAGHLRFGGAGLRMFMDVYVYLRAYSGKLDLDYISDELSKLGLTRFRDKIEKLSYNWFSGETPDVHSILAYHILDSDTFGSLEYAIIQNSIRVEVKDGKRHNAFYRFLHKLFPSFEFITEKYPSAVGKKPLYLFYLTRYWCRRAFIDRDIKTESVKYYAKGTDGAEADMIRNIISEFGLDDYKV